MVRVYKVRDGSKNLPLMNIVRWGEWDVIGEYPSLTDVVEAFYPQKEPKEKNIWADARLYYSGKCGDKGKDIALGKVSDLPKYREEANTLLFPGSNRSVKRYFQKNGFVFGFSQLSLFDLSPKNVEIFKFTDLLAAIQWLHTSTDSYRICRLTTRSYAKKLGYKEFKLTES